MPGMDGYTLAEAIRSEEVQRGVPWRQRMPILALTANALRGEAMRAQAAGMDEYLTKPLQLHLLKGALAKWLVAEGHRVSVTEWNSSALVKAATRTGKKQNTLTPMTFSLLHATDFADRLLYKIIPPLKAGMIVLADRYVYTAFARDVARGVDPGWVRDVYSFAPRQWRGAPTSG